MIVYEQNPYSRTRSFSYIESFILFLTPYFHIWGQGVVCIKCGSMWVGIYTHIPDLYPAGQILIEL
jgi:hypothetical protein